MVSRSPFLANVHKATAQFFGFDSSEEVNVRQRRPDAVSQICSKMRPACARRI
jgi:hypothetical protein